MGWGGQEPLLCELDMLGRPCGAGWVNKERVHCIGDEKTAVALTGLCQQLLKDSKKLKKK